MAFPNDMTVANILKKKRSMFAWRPTEAKTFKKFISKIRIITSIG